MGIPAPKHLWTSSTCERTYFLEILGTYNSKWAHHIFFCAYGQVYLVSGI